MRFGVQPAYRRFSSSCMLLSPHSLPPHLAPVFVPVPSDLPLCMQRCIHVRNGSLLSRPICAPNETLVPAISFNPTYYDLPALPIPGCDPIVANTVPWGRTRPLCLITPGCMCLIPCTVPPVPSPMSFSAADYPKYHLYLPACLSYPRIPLPRYPLCTAVYGVVRVYLQILLTLNYHSLCFCLPILAIVFPLLRFRDEYGLRSASRLGSNFAHSGRLPLPYTLYVRVFRIPCRILHPCSLS